MTPPRLAPTAHRCANRPTDLHAPAQGAGRVIRCFERSPHVASTRRRRDIIQLDDCFCIQPCASGLPAIALDFLAAVERIAIAGSGRV